MGDVATARIIAFLVVFIVASVFAMVLFYFSQQSQQTETRRSNSRSHSNDSGSCPNSREQARLITSPAVCD